MRGRSLALLALVALLVALPASAAPQLFVEHTVRGDFDRANVVYAADVDGDGDIDVLGAAMGTDEITWWENIGGTPPSFIEHAITGDFDGVRGVYATDVDGDSDTDVLGAAQYANNITWWENVGGTPPSFIEHTISGGFGLAARVHAADVDGDNDTDVLGAAEADGITWWENVGGTPPSFIEHTITGDSDGAHSVYGADLDGDGDTDVLGTAWGGDDIIWWENVGGTPPSFIEHSIKGDFGGAYDVYATDLDGDGDMDVLGVAIGDDDITWWENIGGTPPGFVEHTIKGDYDGAHCVYATDVDADGDTDVLGAADVADDITWWENSGGAPPSFIEHTIKGDFDGAFFVYATDIDGDNDTDVLGAAIIADEIAWWENVTPNAAPSVEAGGPYVVDEGGSVTVTGSGSDPDGDALTYAWDLDDDGTFETPGQSVTFSAAELDGPSSHGIAVQVTDTGGLSDTDDAIVEVTNVAPTASFSAPELVQEGSDFTLSLGSPFDPSPADTSGGFVYAFDCGNGYGSFTTSGSAFCPTEDNGIRTVRGSIRDKDGGETEYTGNVVVVNVAPTVGPITAPLDPVQIGITVTASADFTDPGVLDTHTATWDWGDDGTSAGVVTEADGSGSVSGSHVYTVPGVYTVQLTVTDDDGGVGQSIFQYVVVYDPDGGFVTGGGWINSPLGAYAADPTLTGRANFGFVSKYKRGADEPTGQTEFQFRVADLNFHSDSYDWLVIAGARALYKGTGTINGEDSYKFMLASIDGDMPGGGGSDKFRIKIWETDTETIIYDNQMGAADDGDPVTVIGGGSIGIHK